MGVFRGYAGRMLEEVLEKTNAIIHFLKNRHFFRLIFFLFAIARVHRPITEITIEDCRSFVRDKLREISRGTVEQYRTYLFAAFKYAKVEKQILTHNPWEAVSVVKVMRQAGIEDSRLERLPFTKEELEIIFTKMPRPWRDLALTSFCLFGTRLGNCCRLRWQDVHWDAGASAS